jgi:hypothetical protein
VGASLFEKFKIGGLKNFQNYLCKKKAYNQHKFLFFTSKLTFPSLKIKKKLGMGFFKHFS